MIEIEAPDGTVIEFPEGTSQDQILSVMQSQYGQEPVPALQSYGLGIADMATLGLDDELRGAARAVGTKLRGDERPFPELLDRGIEMVREEHQQARDNPWTYFGGQVTGATSTGLAGGVAASTLPKAIQSAAAARPFLTAVGVGGASGGVYGAGSGEKGQRAESALQGALYGAGGGALVSTVSPLVQRALKLFKKPAQTAVKEITEETLPISGKTTAKPVQELVEEGDATTMLKGAKTQDVELMRAEEMARQGLMGDELETMVRQADDQFIQSVRDTAQSLAGEGTEETAQDTLLKSLNVVKNRFKAEKKLQSAIMNKRNNAIAKAKVYTDYTKETLGNSLKDLKNTPDFKVSLLRDENAQLAQDFKILGKLLSPKTKSVNMSALGAWRSGLNSYKQGTQQSVLARQAAKVYDDWLENHLKTALKEGDEDLAEQIFKANSKYAEFKNKFGTNTYAGQKKVIEDILTQDEMTPAAMVNTVFGKSMGGKDYTSQYVKRLLEAVPEGARREQVRQGFRTGLYQKAFEDAYSGDVINLGKFKNNLIKMQKSDAYKQFLSTPGHDQLTSQLIEDIGRFQRATQDRTVVNLSGTTPLAARIMQGFGSLPLVSNLTIARGGTEIIADIAKGGTRAQSKRQAEKSVTEFYKAVGEQLNDQVKFRFGDPATAGLIASSGEE